MRETKTGLEAVEWCINTLDEINSEAQSSFSKGIFEMLVEAREYIDEIKSGIRGVIHGYHRGSIILVRPLMANDPSMVSALKVGEKYVFIKVEDEQK